jgi:hypothetical protein
VPIRRRRTPPEVPEEAARAFLRVAAHVDEAKSVLMAAMPSPRGVPGAELPGAILGFEAALREASGEMAGWRTPETEGTWQRCAVAVEDALAAAERLRLAAPNLGYESLVAVLADLMDPLATFEEAERLAEGKL